MKKIRIALFAAILALMPRAASADPITASIAVALGGGATATAIAAFIVRIGTSLLLSALASALAPKTRAPGIKTETTTAGGNNPQSFIIGQLYATAGNMVAPPYSHPNNSSNPNIYLTYVLDVSDVPGVAFSRLSVGGSYVDDWQASAGTHDQEGMFEGGKPHLFMSFHDGNQVAADPYMMENYASYPERPWGADMIGQGIAYAVLTFKYNRELFNAMPAVRFEASGIPLYDPRLDDTVGGTGTHRWADPATWAASSNNAVMIYNILRGIALPGGKSWGGKVAADSLPLDSWFSAMNECDVAITLAAGGTEPQYRAGFEVSVDTQPAQIIEEILKACSGEMAEMGGVYKLRVGPPALPVYFFSDDDVVADQNQRLVPYPGITGVHNAIHATHPAPAAIWAVKEAPAIYNADWEAEDGGRQLVASVQLPAVSSDTQVQRLMMGWIKDGRRFRRHNMALPPEAAMLEPLDVVSWTSARNGYTAKAFEIGEISDNLTTCVQSVSMREREAGDFTWLPVDEIVVDHPSVAIVAPVAMKVESFAAVAAEVEDASGTFKIPALSLSWDGVAAADSRGIEYELRLAGSVEPAGRAFTADAASGALLVTAGILPSTSYEVRALVVIDQAAAWCDWVAATTNATGVPAAPVIGAITVTASPVAANVTMSAGITHPAVDGVAWFRVRLIDPAAVQTEFRVGQVGQALAELDPATLGTYRVLVAAIGFSGWPSAEVETDFIFSNGILTPATVADFRIRVAGEFATLSWAAAGPMVSHYIIRHLSSAVSGGWPEAMDMEARAYGQSLIVPALAGTYLIRAVSVYGVLAAAPTTVQTSAAGLASLNVAATIDEAPAFVGVKTASLAVNAGKLELISSDPGDVFPYWGEYSLAAPFDLSEVYNSRVSGRLVAFGYSVSNTMDGWPVLANLGLLAGDVGEGYSVDLKIRTTLDAPGPGFGLPAPAIYGDGDAFRNTTFNEKADAFFAIDLAFTAAPAGTIVEAGGAGWGFYCGFNGADDFVARCGGGGSGHPTNCAKVTVSAAMLAGKAGTLYLGILDADLTLSIWFHEAGQDAPALLGSDVAAVDWVQWAGSDVGGWGFHDNDFAGSDGGGVFNGTISEGRFYDTTTPPVFPTWTDWQDFQIGDYVARGYDFKLTLETLAAGTAVRVSEYSLSIDMPDRVEGGDDVACPAGGVAIVYAPGFKARPAVTVDGQSLPVGARSVRTLATRTGFHQQFIDDLGAGVACTFDWVAKGYGRTE